jgi:hypothetical protein
MGWHDTQRRLRLEGGREGELLQTQQVQSNTAYVKSGLKSARVTILHQAGVVSLGLRVLLFIFGSVSLLRRQFDTASRQNG